MIPLYETIFIGPEATLQDAIGAIDQGECGIALVVDDGLQMIGVVTDHDVRRALLSGEGLGSLIGPYVNCSPVTADADMPRERIYELIRRTGRSPVPLLDGEGRVVGLESLNSVLNSGGLGGHTAVIMAGGLGLRLRPLTERVPKPMLPVRDKPVLQIILEKLRNYGFRRIFISVNHCRDAIESFFGNGGDMGLDIDYLREDRPRGTAGSLKLLPVRPERPFMVMNGDLLTNVNFESLMRYHRASEQKMTVCTRPHEVRIPYGVVRLSGQQIVGLEEKPAHTYLVNAGIYVLDPEVLDLIPQKGSMDMPNLISETIDRWNSVGTFPIHEYWLDIGQHHDYERAHSEYADYV